MTGLRAQPATVDHYDRVLRGDAELVDTDGRIVLRLVGKALPQSATDAARAFADLDTIEPPSLSRRGAAGVLDVERFRALRTDVVGVEPVSPTSGRLRLADGRVLRQVVSNPVYSYLGGYTLARYGHTAQAARITKRHPERWARALPYFAAVDDVLRREMPEVHARHAARCARHPQWVIPGTALSTVTINVNYESRYHKDTGDFRDGYSTLAVVEVGRFTGGLLVFPEHRVAVDVRERDVLLCQSHVDLHGNTPIEGVPGAKRVSLVTYLKHGLARATNAMGSPC